MLRRLLAIAAPLSLAAAAHAASTAPPAWTSIPARAAAVPAESGAGPQAASRRVHAPNAGASASLRGAEGAPGGRPGAVTAAAPSTRSGSDSPLFGANGDAINIEPLGTCIACTGSGAAPRDSSSYSRSIRVADESLAEGESPANGYTGGSIISLPPNSFLALAIGSWHADNRHDATSAEGHSSASAGELGVGDGQVATVGLFDARSDATRSGTRHRGSAASDAARASLSNGQVTIVVLHSDTSSDGPGHVYLAQLNENQLMTSDELMGGFPVTVPNVANVNVLRGATDRAVVCELTDSKSNDTAEIVSTSTGNTSGPRNQTK